MCFRIFQKSEAALFAETAAMAVDCLDRVLEDGIEAAMTKYNGGTGEAA